MPFLLLEQSRCIGTAHDTPLGTASAAFAGVSCRAVTRGDPKRRGEPWLLPEQSQGRLQGMLTAPCTSTGAQLQAMLKAPPAPNAARLAYLAVLQGGRAGWMGWRSSPLPGAGWNARNPPPRVPTLLHRPGYLLREPRHGAWPRSARLPDGRPALPWNK